MPTIDATHTTLLAIDGIELSPYATRSITMSVAPIQQNVPPRRDCNGTLVDVSLPLFNKYRATVTGSDFEAPILTEIWRGQRVFALTFVPETGISEGSTGDTAGQVTLNMRIMDWNSERKEQEGVTDWQLEFEEV